ncbi:hypothetical protein Tco_0980460 [Tanacetum coccineum]
MTNSAAQQVALDNALVPLENRVEIGKCNLRIDPAKTKKEPTYQVILDALALTTCYPAFLITADVPEIYMHQEIFQICPRLLNQEFDELLSDEEIVSFIKELGHKGDIKSVSDAVVDHMFQPWRTFSSIINKCLSGKITGLDKLRLSRAQILWRMFYKKNVDFVKLLWEDFTFQIDNRNHKKQEKMYYPRFTKAIIHHFITKDKSISMRNRMFMHTGEDDSILVMTNQKMRDSPSYKTYLAFATGATSVKKERKFKKPASPSRKSTLVTIEEVPELAKKKKKPAKAERSKGIDFLSEAALLEEAQVKKVLRRSHHETSIHQAGGSGDETGSTPGVPDEPKGKSVDTHKGTGLKPGVLDVSTADSSESENESYEGSGDEANIQNDDDLEQANDELTKTDNPRTSDEEEIQDDEYVHNPKDYVPMDDEMNDESNDLDEEEYERINEVLYGDVNVRLTNAEPDDEEQGTKEMIDAGHVDAEHENVNQEGVGNQVKDDAQAT